MASIRSKVVGVSKKNPDGISRQALIKKLAIEGEPLQLEREPANEFDPNAIAVYIDDFQIGYISSDLARTLAPIMDSGGKVKAEIAEITGGTRDRPTTGLNIIVDYDKPTRGKPARGKPAAGTQGLRINKSGFAIGCLVLIGVPAAFFLLAYWLL